MENDMQRGETSAIQKNYKTDNPGIEGGSYMNFNNKDNKHVNGKTKNNPTLNNNIAESINHYSYRLIAKTHLEKTKINSTDESHNNSNSNYLSSEADKRMCTHNSKSYLNKEALKKCIDNTVIQLAPYIGSIGKKPPKASDVISNRPGDKLKNKESSNHKTSNFFSNNTHKTTNCSDANYDKSEALKYSSNNLNTNFSSLSSKGNSENNTVSIENKSQKKDLKTVSYNTNNLHANNQYNSLKNEKLRIDFETLGQIVQEEGTLGRNSDEHNKNNFNFQEGNIHDEKIKDLNNEVIIIEEGTFKKEELDNKINEIKIYLKMQFEKGSEKKDFNTIDDISTNNNYDFPDNKKNIVDKFKVNLDKKYENSGNEKESNYLLLRSKSNCEALKRIKNELKSEEMSNKEPHKSKNANHNDYRRREKLQECLLGNNSSSNKTNDALFSEANNEKMKDKIFSNLKLLYDKDSSRSKKRTEQIKRIRSSKSVASGDFENMGFREKNFFKNDENNYCLSQHTENLSYSCLEKQKSDLIDTKDYLMVNKNNNNNPSEAGLEENKGQSSFKIENSLDEKVLNNSEKSIHDDNLNSSNISSLNITYINNVNNNCTSKENNTDFSNDKKPNNANIKNNRLLVFNENLQDHNYNNNNHISDANLNYQNSTNKINNFLINNNHEIKEIHSKNNIEAKQTKEQGISNAFLNVSDLDIQLEEEQANNSQIRNEDNRNNYNISMLKNMNNKNSTFVNIKNNLKIKSDLEENKTESYMMALNGYSNSDNKIIANFNEDEEIDKKYFQHENNSANFIPNQRDSNVYYENNHIQDVLVDKIYKNKGKICPEVNDEVESNDLSYHLSSNTPIYKKNEINKNQISSINGIDENIINLSYNNYNDDYNNNYKKPENKKISRRMNQQQNQQGHSRSKSQEVSSNNFKIPSGRKYMVNSVIMEEISENYTDSEFSNKKKSFLISKSKLESSEKIIQSSNKNSIEIYKELSHFNFIEKNLEKEIFNKMKSDDPKISKVESIGIDLKNNLIEHIKEIQNKKQTLELKQKIIKENKKREILDLFYHKSNLGFYRQQGSKSENKPIASFQREIQLGENPKTQSKNSEIDSKNHIQNILNSKFNFNSKNEKDNNLFDNLNMLKKNEDKNGLIINKRNTFCLFSDKANPDYNASSINLLNYTNSYKNLINVNSLSILNLNSNNKNYNSLTSTSNKKFSACKKSPSSLNRERFYDENNFDFSKISKNLNIDKIKLNLNNILNDESSKSHDAELNLNNNLTRNKDLNYVNENNNKTNSIQFINNKKVNYEYNGHNEDIKNNGENHDRKIDFLTEENTIVNRKVPTRKAQNIIDTNINISLNNSSSSQLNNFIKYQNPDTFDKINNDKQNDFQITNTYSNNTSSAYYPNTNLTKLEIELKSNSPIRQASNKDFDETMNVITESSLRNFNFNFNNNNNNNNNSNVNSNNATLINIYPNYVNTNNNISNANSILSYNHNTTYMKKNIKEKYKKERKLNNNSSIFKSEDMRLSKMELLNNMNNLNSNTNNNSLYYNNSSNNYSNNTLMNFNCNIVNNANNNSNNNTVTNKENSNLFNNNNINNTNRTSNNSSFAHFNLNFNKNNLNNLNTNSLSDYVNFNNNICSPLSTGSNLNTKNNFAGNILGINSNEKKQNKTYTQYDSKSEGVYNVYTGTLTPSRQNSFNLNVFVSRNDSNGLVNFNNNNINTNNINWECNLNNTHTNNYLNTEKNSNINDNLNENPECHKGVKDCQNQIKNENYYPASNKGFVNEITDNNLLHNAKYNPTNKIRNNNTHSNNYKNNKLNIDRNFDISILENNDINEDCVEDQKNDVSKYKVNNLQITSEIELQFSNKTERQTTSLVKSKSNEIFIKKATGIIENSRMNDNYAKNKKMVVHPMQESAKNSTFNISETNNTSCSKNVHNKNYSDCFIQSQIEIVKNVKNNANYNMLNNIHEDRSIFLLETIRECDKDTNSYSYKQVKNPINLIYGKRGNEMNPTEQYPKNGPNYKFTTNFLYQNYNKQSNFNPIKTSSIVISNKSGFSNSNLGKNHSHSKSISSSIITKNISIPAAYQSMNSTFNINNQILHTTTNINNNLTARVTKMSPAKSYFETIDKSYSNNININNNLKKQTPLLADFKRYQDKYTKNNENFEYRKIQPFVNKDKKIGKAENTSGTMKINYFDNNNSYNKLVQMDKQNYSNNLNKTSNNETAKNTNTKNYNLQKYGLNYTNMTKISVKMGHRDEHNNNKKEDFSPKEEKKRPASSNCNKILKIENYTKINPNQINNRNNVCQEKNNEKSNSRNKIDSNKNARKRENSYVFLPNVDQIIKCLKFVKFPKNYIDNYKIVLDKLQHSKNNKFLISVLEDKKHLEFKGLYEFQDERDMLNLIYCANYCEAQIDLYHIKKFFKFCKDTKTFKEENSFSKECLLFIV